MHQVIRDVVSYVELHGPSERGGCGSSKKLPNTFGSEAMDSARGGFHLWAVTPARGLRA